MSTTPPVPPIATAPRSSTPAKGQPQSLSGLLPFLRPYRWQIALAGLFLVLAAVATLAFPLALRSLIDGGLVPSSVVGTGPDAHGAQLMALRQHFLAMFAVAAALGLFSAGRFYMVSWLASASRRICATRCTAMCCTKARSFLKPRKPAKY